MAFRSKISGLFGKTWAQLYVWAAVMVSRPVRLYAVELAGLALCVYGVSLWSLPAALIIAGLALIAAIEVRA